MDAAPGPPPAGTPPSSSPPPHDPPSRSRPGARLVALFHLWTLQGARDLPTAGDGWLLGLALAVLALWIVLDHLRAGAGAQLEPMAVPILALYALLALALAFALSRVTRPR